MMVLLKDMILVNTGIMHWAHSMKKLTQFQSLLRLISFSNETKCRRNVLLMMTLNMTLRPTDIYLTTQSMIHFVHMFFFDNDTKQYLLRVRRSSATVTLHKHSKGKASTLGIKDIGVFDNRNKREDEYTNATGISAKIQRLFDPIFVWADDTPDAAADFAPTKIMGKLISEETAKFKESLLWKNFLDAHKKAFITGGDESDMQIDSQPSLQEKLNSIASAIGMRMNEQYGGSNAVQFRFLSSLMSQILLKWDKCFIHETSSDSSNDKDVSFWR